MPEAEDSEEPVLVGCSGCIMPMPMLTGRGDAACCVLEDIGGAGNTVVLKEEEGIGFAPRGPLPILDGVMEDVENDRVEDGLRLLGDKEMELVRCGGDGMAGGCGVDAGFGDGKGDEKEMLPVKGDGEVGLLEPCVAKDGNVRIMRKYTRGKRRTSAGEAKMLPHTSSLQSVPPAVPVVSDLTVAPDALAPPTRLSKSTG